MVTRTSATERKCAYTTALNSMKLKVFEAGAVLCAEMLRVFKKPHEVTEGEELRDALRHKDTRITVTSPEGKHWTFVNDTAADCSVLINSIVVSESKDKQDILTNFWVKAKNGRIG